MRTSKLLRRFFGIGLALVAMIFMYITPVAAHYNGQSNFTINNAYTVIENEAEELDRAPRIYTPGETLYFQVDTTKLPTPAPVFARTTIIWDFGDGTPRQSLKGALANSHTYQQEGTYYVTVLADYTTAGFDIPEPEQLEKTLIEVKTAATAGSAAKAGIVLLSIAGAMLIARLFYNWVR